MNDHLNDRLVRNYILLAGCYFLLLIATHISWSFLSVSTYGVEGLMTLLCLVGAASSIYAMNNPRRPSLTAESMILGVGLLLVIVFAASRISFALYQKGFNLAAVVFLLMMSLTYQVAEEIWRADRAPMRRVDDTLFGIAVAGILMTLSSLLVLPWYKLSFGRESVSFSFFDWKDLYDEFNDDVSNVRILYFETGYLASIIAAIVLGVIVYKGRTNPLKVNPPLRWIHFGTIVLMGLWSLVLVISMQDIDSDGSVQFGAWLCVIGHVLMGFSTWRASAVDKGLSKS